MDRRALGTAAETRALDHLLERGLKFLCRNFSCRAGELDLVMLEGATLVIVEVRARQDRGYGTATDSIGPAKRRRIVRAAHYLLLRRPELRRLPVRFDVVALKDTESSRAGIEWIRGAFDAAD